MIPGLEGVVESQQAVDADRVRFYLEALENAAEAREAAAARLRLQIQETAKKFPSVFSPTFGDVSGGDNNDQDGSTDGEKKQDVNDVNDVNDGFDGNTKETADAEGDAEDGGEKVETTIKTEGDEGRSRDNGSVAEEEKNQARDENADGGEGSAAAAAVAGDDAGETAQAGKSPADDNTKTAKKGDGQGNVFGIAGKFLRDVLHIPPGGGGSGADASAVAQQSSNAEEKHDTGGGDVNSPAPVEATVVDATSPTTPVAIAADSVCVGAAPEKSDEDDSGVGEGGMEGVSIEAVMVDTA